MAMGARPVPMSPSSVSNEPTPYILDRHSTWTMESSQRTACWLGWIGLSHFGQTDSPFASRLFSSTGVISQVGYLPEVRSPSPNAGRLRPVHNVNLHEPPRPLGQGGGDGGKALTRLFDDLSRIGEDAPPPAGLGWDRERNHVHLPPPGHDTQRAWIRQSSRSAPLSLEKIGRVHFWQIGRPSKSQLFPISGIA